MLYVSTRRGRQFNSMVYERTDPLTGAARDEILVSREDCQMVQLYGWCLNLGNFVDALSSDRCGQVILKCIGRKAWCFFLQTRLIPFR